MYLSQAPIPWTWIPSIIVCTRSCLVSIQRFARMFSRACRRAFFARGGLSSTLDVMLFQHTSCSAVSNPLHIAPLSTCPSHGRASPAAPGSTWQRLHPAGVLQLKAGPSARLGPIRSFAAQTGQGVGGTWQDDLTFALKLMLEGSPEGARELLSKGGKQVVAHALSLRFRVLLATATSLDSPYTCYRRPCF